MNHSHHINNSNTFESSNLLNSHLQHLESSSHLLQNDKINKANMEPFIHINSIHSLQPSQNNNQTFQTINGVVNIFVKIIKYFNYCKNNRFIILVVMKCVVK